MSKYWKIAGAILIVTLVVVLTGISITAAQDEPVTPVDPEPSVQPDIPLSYWGGGRGPGAGGGVLAVDQTAMHEAIAGALGISVAEMEAAVADGQTLYALAQELGVDWAEVQAAMQAVHAEALQAAVDEGLITQERADWMNDRSQMGSGNNFGGGMRGSQFGGQQGSPGGRFGGGQFGGRGRQALSET